MKSGLCIAFLSMSLILVACAPSPNRVQTVDGVRFSSDGSHLAVVDPDTVTFEEEVRGFLALPDEEQEVVRDQAEKELDDWRSFEWEARNRHDSLYRYWYHDPSTRWGQQHQGVGLGNGLVVLKKAVDTDPSFVEAWTAMGHLANQVGDWNTALDHFDNARVAADIRRDAGRPVDDDVQLSLYRARAWVLRDLARWDEGLAAVDEGLAFKSGDQDLILIKGLLLAGAGRYSEAVSVAVRMPPFRYPQYNIFYYGLKYQTSSYANNWIRSQALMAEGDYAGARRILGEMKEYPYRALLVHSDRFWRDVGAVAELAGDPKAGLYYAIGHITREYWGFFPVTADALGELVLDVPDPRLPVFSSFGGRFYAGGSYLSYIAVQMNRMALANFAPQKEDAAGRALQALAIAERRNIRPDVCRALRGRVYYYNNDFNGARRELLAARTVFRQDGKTDAGTSLLLGMLELQGDRHQGAARFLEETVEADPRSAVAWRTLGVVYDKLGLTDRAVAAMDRAVELEPRSVTGLYNRGLFHLQHGEAALAAADLRRAAHYDPDNREVQRMLHQASRRMTLAEQEQLEPATLPADEDPDQMLAEFKAEIEAFFADPDSLGIDQDDLGRAIRDLQASYVASPDPGTRKILALAYIDARKFELAQELLAPGWGVDLGPDEEVMLLYIDHELNEVRRARELADALVRGEASRDNPYAMVLAAMTIRKDARTEQSQVDAAFLKRMGYGIASESWTSSFQYSEWMRIGFDNYRGAWRQDLDIMLPVPAEEEPIFRALNLGGAEGGSVSGGVPTAGSSRVK